MLNNYLKVYIHVCVYELIFFESLIDSLFIIVSELGVE